MGIINGVKKTATSFFNLRQWADYDRLKESSKGLKYTIKNLFIPAKPQHPESFEQAMQRLQLSESDIKAREREFYYLALLMFGLMLAAIGYMIYHIASLHIFGAIVSVAVVAVAASLAFRYHFWYFQTKQRKLGCSFKEWFTQGLLGRKP